MKHSRWIDLENAQALSDSGQTEAVANERIALNRLLVLVHNLRPADRQIMLLYLEGFESEAIAETVGISPTNVTTKIHRIKGLLARLFQKGPFEKGKIDA